MIPLRAWYAAADRIGDPICYLNHREAPVKAEAEGAQVSLGVLVEVEGMKSAAEAGLEVTQQSVDPAELLGHWGASCW